jgi:acetyltransferase-like isoleucine patch superfamily enzyme
MPITIADLGKNNVIEAPDSFLSGQSGVIRFSGSNNYVKIGEKNIANGILIRLGENCRFESGDGNRLGQLSTFSIRNTSFKIGSRTGFTAKCALHAHEAFNISIGDRCLIAGETVLSVSDMHSILSIETGERLNPGGSIVLEDHVWLGAACRVLKGVRIGTGSVVGVGAIVTKDIPENSVAAGVPAQVVRSGITWMQKLV